MKRSLVYFCLISIWGQDALAQSYANIKVFPLGETADSLYREGYFRKVLPYAQHAFASFGDMPVSDTSTYAKAMYRLGEIEYQSGYYDLAFPHLQGAFSLYYGQSGMIDDICARMCCALSHAMIRELRWADDDAMLTRMIAEAERSKGVSEFARISIRWCQGNVYHNQRKYAEAKEIYERCKTNWEVIEATKTEEYCLMLDVLSALYNQMDNEEKAMQLDLTGLDIHHQVYGARHPGSAIFLNALAENNRRLENWSVSMAYYEELIAILREKIGEDNWMLGLVLFDLGYLNTQIGDYKQAEHLEEEALKITLAAHGKSHPEYAMIISGLGRLAQLQGNLDKADSLFQESLQVRIETLGKRHPYYPGGLSELASVYLDKNQPNTAYPLLTEALAAQKNLEGPRHSSVAMTLQQMALCKLLEARYAEADSMMGLSGELFRTIFGEHSQIFSQNLDNRILTRMCLDRTDEHIVEWANQGHNIWKNTAQRAMGYASPRQLESLLFSLSFHNNLVNVVGALGNAAGLAYDNALLFKNLALQSRADIFRKWNINGDTTALAGFKYWQQIQRRLSDELTKPQENRRQVDSLENLLQQLERNFAVGAGLSDRIIPDWRAVQGALQPDEAAIEFVHYTPPPGLPDAGKTRYAALLLLPGNSSVRFIPLFEESRLAALLERHIGDANTTAALYVRSGALLDEQPHYGADLFNLIWGPLDSLLRGVKAVYFAPSGLLHRVSFSALPVSGKKVLSDKYELYQLGSTRSIVVKTPEPIAQNYTAAVFGGIQYERNTTIVSDSTAPEITDNRLWTYMDGPRSASDEGFEYLPGTAQEAARLTRALQAQRVQVQTHTGKKASEEMLKSLSHNKVKSPDILHIATHGFFFPDPKRRNEQRFGKENAFEWNENPLFRSGLALSGANAAWSGLSTPSNVEDGIATAYEISLLNLSNTKLVVLSACESGLGDIKGSEGVYGLQRAFKMAGADYLLVSLWQVPDKETVEFMDLFYKSWLGGKTIHEAFAKAQKKMRKKYKEVYKWGAWVLVE